MCVLTIIILHIPYMSLARSSRRHWLSAALSTALWALAAMVPLLLPRVGATAAPDAPVVVADQAWVRATVSATGTAAYLRLRARAQAAVVEVRSPLAGVAELHEMALVGGVMRMRAVDRLELRPGEAVTLQPGGLHLMLMDLRRPLKAGESVPLELVIERPDGRRELLKLQATVRPMGAAP